MAENSKIEWTDATFNPWLGCTKVSDGCKHCYAETLMDKRYGRVKWGPQGTRQRTSDAYWKKPLAWNRKAEAEGRRWKVFCASLADVFEDFGQATTDRGYVNGFENDLTRWRMKLWYLIDWTPHLDWLLLTKRPENVVGMVPFSWLPDEGGEWPANVWIGTSVENQEMADRRIPELLKVPARIRFLSCEPLLGPVDLQPWLHMTGIPATVRVGARELPGSFMPFHWVIVGGESGQKARLFYIEWAQDLVKQCDYAGVPVFVKQLGSNPRQRADLKNANWRLDLRDKKGGDMSEWPPELRIRQFPPVEQAR